MAVKNALMLQLILATLLHLILMAAGLMRYLGKFVGVLDTTIRSFHFVWTPCSIATTYLQKLLILMVFTTLHGGHGLMVKIGAVSNQTVRMAFRSNSLIALGMGGTGGNSPSTLQMDNLYSQ